MRVLIFGNAGSGKSTMARALSRAQGLAHLSLDDIAWNPNVVRKPLTESVALLDAFVGQHASWVMEGCYGDLVEAALPHCTELRFLNPGVDACLANARMRPWEADKFPSPAEQGAMVTVLLDWIRQYESRDDEFGLQRHRAIFERFAGPKREYASLAEYAQP